MALPWPASRNEQLAALWPAYSATEIAAMMTAEGFTVSRNAVIGRAHRVLNGTGKPASLPWSDEASEILRVNWRTHSSAKIADMLAAIGDPRTAASVMTKARREGLTEKRNDEGRKYPVVKHARIRKPNGGGRLANKLRAGTFGKLPRKPKEASPVPDEPKSRDLTILTLNLGQCRWPHGDGPILFCGAPTDGSTYCTHHHARAYQPPESQGRTNRNVRYLMRHA